MTIIQLLISSGLGILGTVLGYCIAFRQQKKEFLWNCYLKYLQALNVSLYKIRNIIIELEDLEKIPALILNQADNKCEFKTWKDFELIKEDVFELRKTIKNLDIKENEDYMNQMYKENYIIKANDILYFDKFTEIYSEWTLNVSRYYHLISKELRVKNDELLTELFEASKNRMKDFDIREYERKLSNYVEQINEHIDSFKIK